ncbi:MAG: TlpA family protein disulfide reductase [Bacteroidaceae bacterium]|nr:TlpA family protein disulfide reductase [Bacteroidaceae bacterium]
MKKHWIPLTLLTILCSSCNQLDANSYLKKVIAQLETIQSASYHCRQMSWEPKVKEPIVDAVYVHHEYKNPEDTIIGASYVSFNPNNNMSFEGGYNGKVKLIVYREQKGVVEDDFTARPLPFRPINTPFFNKVQNMLQYAIETTDSIQTNLIDEDSCYHFCMTIFEDNQVEFFGKAVHLPQPPTEFAVDPISHYEIWIRKSDNLPYKILRKMAHNVSSEECIQPTFNEFSLADFNLYSYIPEDYELRKKEPYNAKKAKEKTYALQDQLAPEWTLTDIQDYPVSLKDIKSKVVLLNFTGIGCGACQAAIPFLKELKSRYTTDNFELIAIESWSNRTSSRKSYAENKELNYLFLGATEEVLKDYQTGRSAPWFFILDENHIVRKIISGYSLERTGKEISQAIDELLK